jgi:hypothetical protein
MGALSRCLVWAPRLGELAARDEGLGQRAGAEQLCARALSHLAIEPLATPRYAVAGGRRRKWGCGRVAEDH